MDSPVTSLVASPMFPVTLPGWTLPRGRELGEIAAGISGALIVRQNGSKVGVYWSG